MTAAQADKLRQELRAERRKAKAGGGSQAAYQARTRRRRQALR
jgi:hypothetical protein